jgi:hypothetical protein
VQFALPGADHADGWHLVVDTAAPPSRPSTGAGGSPAVLSSGTAVDVTGRSVMVLSASAKVSRPAAVVTSVR